MIDQSAVMGPNHVQVAAGLASLCDSLRAEPITSAKLRLTVLGFAEDVQPRLASCDPSSLTCSPDPVIRGVSDYGAVFADLLYRIPGDVQALKANGYKVQRPIVFMLTSGQHIPWRIQHRELTDLITTPVAPNIVAFGVGDAAASAVREIASRPEFALITPAATDARTAISDFFHAVASSLLEFSRGLGSGATHLIISEPGHFRAAGAGSAVAPAGVPNPKRATRLRRLSLVGGALVIALVAGVIIGLSSNHGAHLRTKLQVAAERKPFIAAVYALSAAPDVRYQSRISGVGLVDVRVTNHDEMVGTITQGGQSYGLLQVAGRLYLKPPPSGLPNVTNKAESEALKGRWLTGHAVQAILGPIQPRFLSPHQLARQLATALETSSAFPPVGNPGIQLNGVHVLAAKTSLGVLYVTRDAPHRIVRLVPASDVPIQQTLSSVLDPPAASMAEVAAYQSDAPNADGTDFPPQQPGDAKRTENDLVNATEHLSDAIDGDLQFNLQGNGQVNCGDGGCDVRVTVTNTISPGSPDDTKITGGSVQAEMIASLSIEGEPTDGCTSTDSLPLNGTGEISCADPGAGGVFASVEAEKKAEAEAESRAANGAKVPYYIHYNSEFYVYATAQVNVAQLVHVEKQEAAQSAEGQALQTAIKNGLVSPNAPRNHRNGAMAEEFGWQTALADGQVGIQGPGRITAIGPDYFTYDPVNSIITVWDAKYSTSGAYPSQLSIAKLRSWLPYLKAAVDSYTGPDAAQVQAAFASGGIEGDIYVYYPYNRLERAMTLKGATIFLRNWWPRRSRTDCLGLPVDRLSR